MKQLNFLFTILIATISINLQAQSDDQAKLENLKYYLTSVKDNVQSMRYYTDSVKIISLLDQIDALTTQVEAEVNTIVVPVEDMPEFIDTPEGETVEVPEMPEPESTNPAMNEENMGQDGIAISKYMPFKKKFNTSLKIEFGINTLLSGDKVAGTLYPEINTGGSWYWDFGLMRSVTLGGKESKVAFNYGLSYLKNRFKIENDVRLASNADNQPEFIPVENAKCNPKLNIGYLNVPLGFTFALSRKTKLELGGYVGYRIHTVQKNHLKVGTESIYEARSARYHLNNWLYGATASIDISGFNLIARYNFSKLFKDNPNFDYNTIMIGTSMNLF